jgi:eukaryotic-like serine/threonine-protein kinase
MKGPSQSLTVRQLFEETRALPDSKRHARMLELGADPLQIAEVDAMLVADAQTSAWDDGESQRSGDATSSDVELGAGDQLGSWQLLHEIGSGGMGAVYLAERSDGHFDQRVAIKLIRGIPDTDTFIHFARERQILAKLQHPHMAGQRRAGNLIWSWSTSRVCRLNAIVLTTHSV